MEVHVLMALMTLLAPVLMVSVESIVKLVRVLPGFVFILFPKLSNRSELSGRLSKTVNTKLVGCLIR